MQRYTGKAFFSSEEKKQKKRSLRLFFDRTQGGKRPYGPTALLVLVKYGPNGPSLVNELEILVLAVGPLLCVPRAILHVSMV